MKKLAALAIILLAVSGCARVTEVSRSGFYLDTVFEAKIKFKPEKNIAKKAEQALANSFNRIVQLDTSLNKLSTISEIYALNTMAGIKSIEINADTYNLIKKGITGSILTDGYFDITWEELVRLYNRNLPPTAAEINKARSNIGYLNVHLDKNFNRIRYANNDVKISLDRIKHGFAIDMMIQDLARKDFAGYIKAGEVTYFVGRKTEKIKLTARRDIKLNVSNRALVVLDVEKDEYLKSAIEWSKYLPVEVSANTLQKVIVVAPNAVTAEVLANAFYFMGPEKAKALINSMKTKVQDQSVYNAVFVTNDPEPRVISTLDKK